MTVAPERDTALDTPHRRDLRVRPVLDEPHRRLPGLRFPHLQTERLRSSRTSLGTGFLGIAASLVDGCLCLRRFEHSREVRQDQVPWRRQSSAAALR